MKKFKEEEFVSSIVQFLSSSFDVTDALKSMTHKSSGNGITASLMLDDINNGMSFSKSFERNIKSRVLVKFIPLVKAGEKVGKLVESLSFINEYLKDRGKRKGGIFLSLIYPAFVLFTILAVFLLLTIFVVPRLSDVFDALKVEEGAGAMLSLRGFAVGFAIVLSVMIVVVIVYFILSTHSSKTADEIDRVLYKFPLFGKQRLSVDLASFCFLVGMFLKTGLTADMALSLSSDCMRKGYLRKKIREASVRVAEGNTLFASLSCNNLLPEFFLSSIQNGEITGDMGEIFSRLYLYYSKEKKKRDDIVAKAAEPVITITLGFIMFSFILVFVRPLLFITGKMK